jgi:hypothetical protein
MRESRPTAIGEPVGGLDQRRRASFGYRRPDMARRAIGLLVRGWLPAAQPGFRNRTPG